MTNNPETYIYILVQSSFLNAFFVRDSPTYLHFLIPNYDDGMAYERAVQIEPKI